ncbi:MAG: hypothetical protein KF723_23130 [Rhizobiaceae bacterium]|nr:hypothetical protein [Rhizobiaceae bacterium]
MSNATHGNVSESGDQMMAAYDCLPPRLRELLRNSVTAWACRSMLGSLRKEIRSGRREADVVAGWAELLVTQDVAAVRSAAKKDWPKQSADYLAAQRPRRRRDWLDTPPKSRL